LHHNKLKGKSHEDIKENSSRCKVMLGNFPSIVHLHKCVAIDVRNTKCGKYIKDIEKANYEIQYYKEKLCLWSY